MGSFTQTFGGGAVSPTSPSYQQLSLAANTQFYWSAFSGNNPNVVARFMNVTPALAGLNMNMPDATLASVGYDTIIYNPGSVPFNVVSLNGNAIAVIQPGTAWYISLISNASQDGQWLTIQFGTGNSAPQAASLAGAGIAAVASQLNLDLLSTPVNTDFGVTLGNLSNVFVWSGGAGVGDLPLSASVGNGFFCMVSNEGTGNLTMTCAGADQIDGADTSVFAPSQSAFLLSTGTGWVTVGKGIQTNYVFSLNLLNVAGDSNVTLTSVQASSVIQEYTGLLTGNIQVIVPNTVQLYIVNNLTTGTFNLTVQTEFGAGVQVPQSSTSILYCDGTNVLSAFSFVPTGSTFVGGSASSPGINWSGNTNTGSYQPATNQYGIALAGAAGFTFTAPASAVNYFNANTAATGNAPTLSVLGADGNISFNHLTKGTGAHVFSTGGGIQAEITNTNTAVNYVAMTGAVTTSSPAIGVAGSDTNINMLLVPKGNGVVAIVNGLIAPLMGLSGSSSGNISFLPQAAAGTYNFNLPTTAGTTGQVLASGGGGSSPMTWANSSTGSVTSVAAGTGLAGGTITTTGTISLGTQTANTVLGNGTGSTAVPTGLTISQVLNLLGSVKGELPYVSATSTWSALGIGSTGQVLTVASGLPSWANATTGIGSVTVQKFSSSATYTPTAGTKYVEIKMVGGGGGGGGVNTAGNSGAGGGGSGGYIEVVLTAAQIGASLAISIGAAGTAGSTSGGNGGNGGNTTVGASLTAGGGTGGTGSTGIGVVSGGTGGTNTVSTGSVSINYSSPGSPGFGNSAQESTGGYGGTTPMGQGGVQNFVYSGNATPGFAGTGFGSGGSGGANQTATAETGGAGAAGYVTITEYQ